MDVIPSRQQQEAASLPITATSFSGIDRFAIFLVKLGLAFVFSYAAIAMSVDPTSYTHYIPLFVRDLYDPVTLLHAFSVFEILLSIWLLSGKGALYAAIVAFGCISAITFLNLDSFSIIFRNISIVFSALALVFVEWRSYKLRGQRK